MPNTKSRGVGYDDPEFTTLNSTGDTSLATGSGAKIGFFGVTAIVRRVNSGTPAVQTALTTALASVTVTGAYGFALSSGFSAMLAQLEEIRAALVAYGILTGP
jgi:hypothetical protein